MIPEHDRSMDAIRGHLHGLSMDTKQTEKHRKFFRQAADVMKREYEDRLMYDVDKIEDTIPEECDITIAHALTHIDGALAAALTGDMGQHCHDLNVAGRILLVLSHHNEPGKKDEEGQ